MRDNLNIDEKITFGCEIEFFSPYSLRELQNYTKLIFNDFTVDYDCPMSDLKEAVSPILTVKDLKKLKIMIELLEQTRSVASLASGAHIHFGAKILDDKNLINFLKLWCISEEVIYDFAKGEYDKIRKGADRFAAPIRKDLTEIINNNPTDLTAFKYFYKGSGLNLANHLQNRNEKDTYEVRVPNGTINYEIWLNNIDFFANLFTYGNKFESVDLINYYYQKNDNLKSDELANIIFNNDKSKHYFNKQINGGYIKTK